MSYSAPIQKQLTYVRLTDWFAVYSNGNLDHNSVRYGCKSWDDYKQKMLVLSSHPPDESMNMVCYFETTHDWIDGEEFEVNPFPTTLAELLVYLADIAKLPGMKDPYLPSKNIDPFDPGMMIVIPQGRSISI